jgi:hypothetical protein
MSEPQGAPAPVVPPVVAVPPAPATAAVPPPPAVAGEPTEDPPWLAGRLARAKTKALADLGFKDEAEARAALEARRAAEESTKTLEQKRLEAETLAGKLKQDNAELSAYVAQVATSRMAALTDAQRSAVTAVAGDNPKLQLSMIDAFASTWATPAAPLGAPPPPAPPKPGQTAAPAPPPPAPGTPKTDFEKWNDLKQTDPVGASLFYQLNSMKIEQSRKT